MCLVGCHADKLTDAKAFIAEIVSPKIDVNCGADRLQNETCSLEIFCSKYKVFC